MGKTVTTYQIDGDPKGTQYLFISNKTSSLERLINHHYPPEPI